MPSPTPAPTGGGPSRSPSRPNARRGSAAFHGRSSRDRLSYHLNVPFELVRLDRPQEFEVSVAGDLTSTGIWTLTPAATASMSASTGASPPTARCSAT